MNLADLPHTPRQQFEALTGKRPDLLFPQHAELTAIYKAGSAAMTDAPLCFAAYHRAGHQAVLVLMGGLN